MRRSMFAVLATAVAAMGTVACEDGPNQSYTPTSPQGAASQNGVPGSTVDPATKDFSYLHGGTNANVLCDGPTLHKVWMKMDNHPILPPDSIGGVNMAGPDCAPGGGSTCSWQGLTIEQAEKVLCQGNNAGDLFGDGSLNTCWGDTNEVCAHYNVSTHKINFMNVDLLGTPGYNGAITMMGCSDPTDISHGHTYVIPAFVQMQKDGQNWDVDWNSAKVASDWRNEFTHALMCTFSGLTPDTDCNSSGQCIQGSFGDVGYLYVPALGAAIWVPNQNAAPPQPSIMYRIDVYLAKVTPFALNTPYLKIDSEGPTAPGPRYGQQGGSKCKLQMGIKFGSPTTDFLGNCVETSNNQATNQSEYNKLLGGISHTTERWGFNVSGVDVNFASTHLKPDQILNDTDLPAPDDPADTFNVDQDTLGTLTQDHIANDPAQRKDLHGTGLVYLQWARIAQRQITALLQAQDASTPARPIGDTGCFGQNAFTYAGKGAGKGCTGLEEVVTPLPQHLIGNPPDAATLMNVTLGDTVDVTAKSMPPVIANMLLGLKPGHQKTAFCDDHTSVIANGAPDSYASCDSNSLDVGTQAWTAGEGDTFQTAYQRVLKVLGGGNPGKLPSEVSDVRFFFKAWVTAAIEYFKSEGYWASQEPANAIGVGDGSKVTLDTLDAPYAQVDPYGLFFDSIGAGQFELAEYVERAFTAPGVPPLDFLFEADVKNGIQDAFHFDRFNYRDEKALYTAMIDARLNPNNPPPPGAQDTALLTNVFGSPMLRTAFKDHTKDKVCGQNHDSACSFATPYYCATHNDPIPCANQVAPLVSGPLTCASNAASCKTDADCPQGDTCGLATTAYIKPDLTWGSVPALAPYEGALSGNATAFTLGQGASPSAAVPITQVAGMGDTPAKDGTYPDLQQVMMQIPLHVNPYDQTSSPPMNGAPAIQVLTDWAPKQPGVGFPVATSGTHDRFIETYQADFSGVEVTANVDYDFLLDSHMQPTTQLLFMAVETTDFLGDLFVCQDTQSHDILTARMYGSVQSILDWLAAHPNTYLGANSCQMILRYSPYGNYLDYVTSLQNGVRLGITQGGGYGRVVDGTLFDPSLPQN